MAEELAVPVVGAAEAVDRPDRDAIDHAAVDRRGIAVGRDREAPRAGGARAEDRLGEVALEERHRRLGAPALVAPHDREGEVAVARRPAGPQRLGEREGEHAVRPLLDALRIRLRQVPLQRELPRMGRVESDEAPLARRDCARPLDVGLWPRRDRPVRRTELRRRGGGRLQGFRRDAEHARLHLADLVVGICRVAGAPGERPGMAGIDDEPDRGAAAADRLHGGAELVVDEGVVDGARRVVPLADVDRQEDLVQPVRLGLRGGGGVGLGLLRAVAREVDDRRIARAEGGAEGRQAIEDRRLGRGPVRRPLDPGLVEAVGEHGHVRIGQPRSAERLDHQRDVVLRSGELEVSHRFDRVVRHADDESPRLRLRRCDGEERHRGERGEETDRAVTHGISRGWSTRRL